MLKPPTSYPYLSSRNALNFPRSGIISPRKATSRRWHNSRGGRWTSTGHQRHSTRSDRGTISCTLRTGRNVVLEHVLRQTWLGNPIFIIFMAISMGQSSINMGDVPTSHDMFDYQRVPHWIPWNIMKWNWEILGVQRQDMKAYLHEKLDSAAKRRAALGDAMAATWRVPTLE